jgi:NuA3 HAT complex component NTO1
VFFRLSSTEMAPLSATRHRPVNSRTTSKARSKPPLKSRTTDPGRSEGPPPKRQRYIPGGPLDVEYSGSHAANMVTGGRTRREQPHSVQLLPTTPPSTRPRRDRTQSRARYSSATAAALALQQGDGYKPREERGWEEFHPELDIEAKFAVFSSEEVDGLVPLTALPNGEFRNGANEHGGAESATDLTPNGHDAPHTPLKRRPGRPPRRPDSLLNGIIPQDEPKPVPLPGPNPRERLTLPKPTFHLRDPFSPFEQKGVGHQNYVDRTMASVGYQESDIFLRHDRRLIRMAEGAIEEDLDLSPPPADGDINSAIGGVGVGRVEYDMDEQDEKWLEDYNAKRREDQLEAIKPAVFEITMTKIEKEWYALEKRIPKPNPKPPQTQRPRSSSAAAVNGEPVGSGEEQDSKCAICDDGDCENSNAIVFCDGCDLAVHQECYGVPYIPEGQWLCRKCQLIGRGSTNCIFCPNNEGAFKQTTTSKWSHLLCAIWIPEVGIGNPSLMEPVTDVEKVPKSRWKLQCYICKQRMGASIQCSNKSCFVAFHVTCARRAQLYLKMKAGHGNPAIMDSNLLKAFCDKHVPPDWRKEHGTDAAYAEAVEYYKTSMLGKRWGDSQAAALALGPTFAQDSIELGDDAAPLGHSPRLTLTVGGNKRKRSSAPKTIWRLPSGAPVIPQVVLNSLVGSLQRFSVRQRKQYAEDACKYWTLKREARRGASLLKRLQLQLETFSSMEMTRRNYAGMGPLGHSRLQRRVDFAERLSFDVDRLRILCDEVKKREKEKLKDAELLRTIVDTVYIPIPSLLWPIFERAQT